MWRCVGAGGSCCARQRRQHAGVVLVVATTARSPSFPLLPYLLPSLFFRIYTTISYNSRHWDRETETETETVTETETETETGKGREWREKDRVSMSAENCPKKARTHTRAIKSGICVWEREQSERLLGREERDCQDIQDFDLILVACVWAESAFAWQGTAAPKHKLCKK